VLVSIGLMTLVGAQTNLWWMRLLMFVMGFMQGQVFVPSQGAAFATITPAASGRAATMFNAGRQLGGAVGVAVLSTAVVAVGAVHVAGGHAVPNLLAYHIAFGVAAAVDAVAVLVALRIRDADAVATIPVRHPRRYRLARQPQVADRLAEAGADDS
jgi:MFS family permease